MDLIDLFFITGPALSSIFKLGFIPTEKDFKELTEHQYECYRRKEGEPKEKIFALLPEDPQHQLSGDDYNELSIVLEHQMIGYQRAAQFIDNYCKDQNFATLTEKLQFMASRIPDCFSEGTPFEKYSHFRIVRNEEDQDV